MSLSYDPSKAEGGEFKILPPGEYEAFISAIDHGQSSNGNEMLTVNYKIRDDVDQEGKGQQIRFDRFVNTDKALWRFHALNKALNVEPGASWDNFKEWMGFIKGKAVKIVVDHEEAEFGKNAGKIFPVVKGFKVSEVGGQMKLDDPSAAAGTIGNTNNGQLDISDDDLPF